MSNVGRCLAAADLLVAFVVISRGILGPAFSLQTTSLAWDPCVGKTDASIAICWRPRSTMVDAFVVWDTSDEIAKPRSDRSARWNAEMERIDFGLANCNGNVKGRPREHEYIYFGSCS
jgi:hypothetical protein